ncbi:winged helix-turn-helix domain-containing protein [Candidatus Saccharibacteria bacterium]|nr:winged helix-turn-helix domain-containing protein [Candidatus Saccharibacteria bacterium]
MSEVKVTIAENAQAEQGGDVQPDTKPKSKAPPKKTPADQTETQIANLEKLFGSRTRVKLLRLFFENPYKSFFVREITRVVDEQVNSVRRELANLETLGVIKKTTEDNKIFYSTDRSYPYIRPFTDLFSRRSVPEKQSEDDIWQELARPVQDILSAVMLISRIPGDNGVEMLVVGDDRTRRLSNWADVVEKRLSRPINYVILSKEDYFYRRSIKDEFLEELFAVGHNLVFDVGIIEGRKESDV